MKHIKLFENFDRSSIDDICKKYNITNYTINEDGSIDVDGDIRICDTDLTKLPLKFGKVSGNFDCCRNKLMSLDGCPSYVERTFNCDRNKLTNLIGCPSYVGGNFYCRENKLTSLEGCPKCVSGWFICTHNKLTSFDGCPRYVGGDFFCNYNNIRSLSGLSVDLMGELYPSPNLKYIYNILKNHLEYINNFYDFNIITDLGIGRQDLNLKRLNKFIDLYDLGELSDVVLNNLKIYYNVI